MTITIMETTQFGGMSEGVAKWQTDDRADMILMDSNDSVRFVFNQQGSTQRGVERRREGGCSSVSESSVLNVF